MSVSPSGNFAFTPDGNVLRAYMRSNAFIRGIKGPRGSGKSVTSCWEVLRRARDQTPDQYGMRKTRFLVVRSTYPELQSTTLKTWQYWLENPDQGRGYFRTTMGSPIRSVMRERLADGTGIDCEVFFVALDAPRDAGKVLSMEYTGVYVNEAKETPKGLIDNIIPGIGRYPPIMDGGPTWFGMIMDTNPPDNDHWWYYLAERDTSDETGKQMVESTDKAEADLRARGILAPDQPLFEFFSQPSGLSPEAENTKWLVPGYYPRLMAGKDKMWIQVWVEGKYGTVIEGKPVYVSEWKEEAHVAKTPLVAIPGLTLLVGVDASGLTPALVVGQLTPRGRLNILAELCTEEIGAQNFLKIVKPFMANNWPGWPVTWWCDPAGEYRSQTDEKTYVSIFAEGGIRLQAASTNLLSKRHEAVRKWLTSMVDGEPAFQVDKGRCKTLIRGFNGSYFFDRVRGTDGMLKDEPKANKYTHPHDGLQYLCLGVLPPDAESAKPWTAQPVPARGWA